MGLGDVYKRQADNGPISEFWQHTYETITRANNVIVNVAKMDINQEDKASYIAQSKFLRAYSYLNLVNIFGKVPLKLAPQDTHEAIHVGLSSIEAIYQQIDADLSDAAAALAEDYPASEAGRVTKGAALALLAKSKLYQKDYSACLDAIATLEQLDIYDLEDVLSLIHI